MPRHQTTGSKGLKRPRELTTLRTRKRRGSPENKRPLCSTNGTKSNNDALYKKSCLPDEKSIRVLKIWPNEDRNSIVEGSLVVWDSVAAEASAQNESNFDRSSVVTIDSDDESVIGSEQAHDAFTEGGYEALSYTWGTDRPSSDIRIFVRDVPFMFKVTSNLQAALKNFRFAEPGRHRFLWVDAICINQGDNEERNAQVAQMSTIFRNARNVCVWLGEKTETSHLAFRLMNRIVDLSDFDELIQDDNEIKLLDEFSKLMSREWFGRRWVVQEIGLARRATIHCGDQWASWDKFSNAVSLFQNAELSKGSISKLFRSSRDYQNRTDVLGDVRFIGASRLVDATCKLFRKSADGEIMDHLLSLEALISQLTTFQASDRRDTIYSVLSLAKDAQSKLEETEQSEEAKWYREKFQNLSAKARQNVMLLGVVSQRRLFAVDYRKSFFEVCKDFLEFAITGSRSLDIICRPWAPKAIKDSENDRESLPSWIPTLVNSHMGKCQDGRHIRINADPLVGNPTSPRRSYNASMDTKAYHVEFGEGPNAKSLFVRGIKMDEISKLQSEALGGNISNGWLRFGGWTDRTADPPEEFWRTLVADRGPEGGNPPIYYKLACKYAFQQGPPDAALNPEQIISSGICSIGVEFLRRVQEVVWNKKLMRSKKLNRLGLTPETAEDGDWICILYGCSVPVILRPMKFVDGNVRRKDRKLPPFKFIGECYVHGMMDGEVFNHRLNQLSKERFELI